MTDIIEDEKWKGNNINWNKLCRLCLSSSDSIILIFDDKGVQLKLREKIEKYLPVKISASDFFPRQVCHRCQNTLLAFDTLYEISLSTEEKLETILSRKNHLKSETVACDVDDVSVPLKKRKPVDEDDETCKNGVESVNSGLAIKSEKSKKSTGKNDSGKRQKKPRKDSSNPKDKSEEDEPETVNFDAISSPVKDDNDSDYSGSIFPEIAIDEENGEGEKFTYEPNGEFVGSQNSEGKKTGRKGKKSGTFRCDACKTVYKTKENLEKHNNRTHSSDQIECPVCRKGIDSKKLKAHLKSVHGVEGKTEPENEFKCRHCEKRFRNKYVRNAHEKEVHLSEPTQCKLCDFKGTRTVLKRHKRYVHAEKRFFCSLCPSAFKTLHTLKLHMTSHSDVRCYTCDICGMGFKRLNNVRDHMKCHQEKSNQCQICGNFFARKRYLAIHEKTIHNFYADGVVPEEKGFECEICGAKLKWKKNLLAHMRIHTGEKPYVCKICNKNFNCHGTLKTHMAKHNVFNEQRPPSQVVITPDNLDNFNPQPA